MNSLLKKLIPKSLLPYAKRLFRRISKLLKSPRLVQGQYDINAPLQFLTGQNIYGKYCVPLSSRDRLAAQKVLSGDVYEPDTIDFMISNCGDGDIVHAGTYFGDFLPALSKACSLQGKVWAFEPNPENYRCAMQTVALNDLSNVELTNAGLGERLSSMTMMTTDADGQSLGGRSLLLNLDDNTMSGGVETVQIVAIDDVIPDDRNVSILQLDVEGHEKQALAGALKTIRRCLPIIIIEAYSGEFFSSVWFLNNLSSLGYRVSHKVHNNMILVCE